MQNANSYSKATHVLLIDDDEDERDIFELAIAQSNLPIELDNVTTCDKEKLSSLKKPDFIFLDINMPIYDGFVWLKGIREKVAERIPVIMYSTTRNPEKIEKAYKMGANLFVSKPETTASLSNILRKILRMNWENPTKLTEESYANDKFHYVA